MRKYKQKITYIVFLLLATLTGPLQATQSNHKTTLVVFLKTEGLGLEILKYIDCENKDVWKALIFNAALGYSENVKYLVERGADIHAKDEKGNTALIWSAKNRHLNIVKYLVEKGTNINARNTNGWTALHYSALNGHLRMVTYLVKHDANVTLKGNDSSTALGWATGKGRDEVINYLSTLPKKSQPDEQILKMWLKMAEEGNSIQLEKLYNTYEINLDTKSSEGDTALIWSAYEGHSACVKFLVEKGADINVKNNWGSTALLSSASMGHLDCLKYLLQQGADSNAKDNDGFTALQRANDEHHQGIIKYLEEQGAK